MGHFSTEAWLDLARDLVSPAQTGDMQAHLNSGCAACAREFAIWASMRTLAGRDEQYEPPPAVLHLVSAEFRQRFPRALPEQESAGRAIRLVFDSFLQPLPAGVRAAATPGRQLLYETGDAFIDLQVQPSERSNEVALVGQILGEQRVGATNIALETDGSVAAATQSNDSGEFCLRAPLGTHMTLRFRLHDGTTITVSLPRDLAVG